MQMHILPLEIFGKSTFSVAQWMLKARIPLWFIDRFLVSYSHVVLGDTSELGIHRPKAGPMALKLKQGKTPVLDVGTLERIRDGHIKVCTAIISISFHPLIKLNQNPILVTLRSFPNVFNPANLCCIMSWKSNQVIDYKGY
jgi:hypothetical protein